KTMRALPDERSGCLRSQARCCSWQEQLLSYLFNNSLVLSPRRGQPPQRTPRKKYLASTSMLLLETARIGSGNHLHAPLGRHPRKGQPSVEPLIVSFPCAYAPLMRATKTTPIKKNVSHR
ncbi:MAG: hypothetical protein QW594_00095, partial [Candidatus Woesearchaeota archaeon]